MTTSLTPPPPFVSYPIPDSGWQVSTYNKGGDVNKLHDFFNQAAKVFSFTSDSDDQQIVSKITSSVKGFPDWLTGIDDKGDSYIDALTNSSISEEDLISTTLKAGDKMKELKANVYDKLGGENLNNKSLLKQFGAYNTQVLEPLFEAYNSIGVISSHLNGNETRMLSYIQDANKLKSIADKLGLTVKKSDGTMNEDETRKAMKKAIQESTNKLASYHAFNDAKLKKLENEQTTAVVTPAVDLNGASMMGYATNDTLNREYKAAKEKDEEETVSKMKAEAKEVAARAEARAKDQKHAKEIKQK